MKKKRIQQAKSIVPDFDLWLRVARTIDPGIRPDVAGMAQSEPKHSPQKAKPAGANKTRPPKTSAARASQPKHPPAFTGIDRRARQRLARGNVDIEARLDLHGETPETARFKLLGFLQRSSQNGLKLVLVITGKGASPYTRHILHSHDYHHAGGHDGVLRKAFPEWLHDSEFRALVSGFQPAHPRHGGGGAFYVRLRGKVARKGRS